MTKYYDFMPEKKKNGHTFLHIGTNPTTLTQFFTKTSKSSDLNGIKTHEK